MKLAVSNIAWPADADAEAAELLRHHGATGVELAPKKVWPDPVSATEAEAHAVRNWWESRGLSIVAFQALLFGRPDLVLFGTPSVRDELAETLDRLCRLAGWVGARALVFGSPKNRLRGERPLAEVWPVAVDFFRRVGDRAQSHGVTIGLEANPVEYGGDFVTHLHDAVQLVQAVNHPGFGLHLDTGGMILTAERIQNLSGVHPVHFHISEPNLAPVGGTPSSAHPQFAADLWECAYTDWVSIEMRQPPTHWQAAVEQALRFARDVYFPDSNCG